MPNQAPTGSIRSFLLGLQERLCSSLAAEDAGARFEGDDRASPDGGLTRPRVLEGGAVFERAAVQFSHTVRRDLPPAATQRRPHLAGCAYEAVSVSVIVHPRNPYVPTTHCNLRFFRVEGDGPGSWWFGGGFDLTPCYGFEQDAVAWHRAARDACCALAPSEVAADAVYRQLKARCDAYFYLPHRSEARGIGGIFFDDLDQPDFERCAAFVRCVGDGFLETYLGIVRRRREHPYGERERAFQLLRRGRYVEFNLLHDRGTRFGLQSGGAVESILASLPPEVRWQHAFTPEPGSAEARLAHDFLRPRDWLSG